MGRQLLVLVSYIRNGIYGSKFYISMKIVFFVNPPFIVSINILGSPPRRRMQWSPRSTFLGNRSYIYPLLWFWGTCFNPTIREFHQKFPSGWAPSYKWRNKPAENKWVNDKWGYIKPSFEIKEFPIKHCLLQNGRVENHSFPNYNISPT